jgi:hypothetical protein
VKARARSRTAAAALILGAAAAVPSACSSEARSHPYLARAWDEGRGCLEAVQSIDVVPGEAPRERCEPVCLERQDVDGGIARFVSTMCPPLPPSFAIGEGDACARAKDALRAQETCARDGGAASM